jgi:Tol biopolymer transport system component
MAVKFDSRSLLITGDPFPIFEQPVIHANLGGWAEYSVSSNGNVLAYRLELPLSVSLQKWTQSGEKVAEIGKMGPWGNQRLSPDGRQLLAVHFDVNHVSDIWRITLEDGNWQRETKQGCAGTTPPAWDPDGKRFAYSCVLESKQEIYIKSLGDPGNGRLLAIAMPANKQVMDWSPDGHFLLVRVEPYGPDGTDGIYRVPLEPDSKPVLLIEDKTSDGIARLSPDGKWIAYASDQSGAPEVYVRGIEKDSPVSQISSGGGYDPAWQRDGKAVYFRTGTFGIMRVTAKPGVATRFSTPTALFQLPTGSDFTPAEGGGFIVASSEGQVNTPITILANWRILPHNQ